MVDFLLGFSCWWWLLSVLFQNSSGRVLSFVFDRMFFQVCLYFYCKFLWRCLKFVMRKLTGRCELQRICYNTKPGASRTMKIGKHETRSKQNVSLVGLWTYCVIFVYSNFKPLVKENF